MKTSLYEALKYHFIKYRKMTPQDAVKLIFQSEYGGGHLITDESYARARLEAEISDTPRDTSIPAVEYLGGSACRVNLASLPEGLSAKTLAAIFAKSAEMFRGTVASFESKLYEVYTLIDEKYAPFSRFDYTRYVEKYLSEGVHAVHHSLYYNSAYRPAYRVIHTDFALLLGVFTAIDKLLSEKGKVLIKIDGRCGSGKSTLAGLIASVYGCGVIHTDDFYLPWDGERENGENTDFGRLNSELTKIIDGDAFHYNVFNCQKQALDGTVAIPESSVLVIEGSYSMHPKLTVKEDISVFLTLPGEEQLRRIVKRSPGSADAFRERWIPMEEAYFTAFNIESRCNFTIDTGK